jgi:hypothetical protein
MSKKVRFLNPFTNTIENGVLIEDPLFKGGSKIEFENLIFSLFLIKYIN